MVKLTVAVTEKNNQLVPFVKRSKEFDGRQLQIGYPVGAPVAPPTRIGSGHKPYKSMLQLRRVMIMHEEGTENMPARPWFGPAIENNEKRIEKRCAKAVQTGLEKVANPKTAMDQVGAYIVGLLRESIRNIPGPPLKGDPIRRKGRSTLLRDTNSAYNSLTWRVK